MCDDFQVGDLAVCVNNGPWHAIQTPELYGQLVLDRIYRVTAVGELSFGPGVDVEGIPRQRTSSEIPNFAAARFRKVRPDQHEACEDDFMKLVKRSKKIVTA
jgi:hypothetical protein